MLAANTVKVSGSEKTGNKNTYDISSIKCAKKCAAQAKWLFGQLSLLLFFTFLVAFAA